MAVILGVATLPLAVHIHKLRGPIGSIAVGTLWIGTTIAFAWTTRINRPDLTIAPPETSMPTEVTTEGYATSDTCRSCHPSEYHSWHSSYHRSMTQLPSATSVLGDFDDKTIEQMGRRFELSQRNGKFYVTSDFITDWTPKDFQTPREEKQIKLLTGSHHMQVYWNSTGDTRKLEQVPIVHLVEQDRWVPRDSVFLMPTRHMGTEAGRWNMACIKCHTTHGDPAMTDNFEMDTRVAEFGIACEECHGPGAEHIAANRDPQRRLALHQSGQPDPTIINPARLSAKRQSDVCGQCHGTFFDRSEGSHNHYRPGDDLLATQDLLELDDTETIERIRAERGDIYLRGKFWSDGMLRVAGRELNGLVRSPCYTHDDESKGILSCMDCHSSHTTPDDKRTVREWANDILRPEALDNTACLKCHEDYNSPEALAKHTHHATESSGSLCYNCHMPHTAYGLLNAIRSHEIESPNVTVSKKTGRPNACNQCHLDKTREWTVHHLNDWFAQPIPELSEAESEIAASVLHIVKGDAAHRALAAWTMGWKSAKEASGSDWIAPYLIQLLDDPYHAVRFIAQRSLRRIPEFAEFDYDFIANDQAVALARKEAMNKFQNSEIGTSDPQVLMESKIKPHPERYKALRAARDEQPIVIAE